MLRSLWVLLLVLPACAQGSASQTGFGLLPPQERAPAPALSGETLEGDQLSLAALDGVVVVNFWASWCGPCVDEAPELERFAQRYRREGVHLVGVNVKDARANALAFQRSAGLSYPSLYDQAATVAASFGGIGPAGLPSTIVLDERHRVAARHLGAITMSQLERLVLPLLEEATR